MKFFEEINVWERNSDKEAVCYRCLKLIPNGGYCVQSADYYSLPHRSNINFEHQFVELFLEESPDERTKVF